MSASGRRRPHPRRSTTSRDQRTRALLPTSSIVIRPSRSAVFDDDRRHLRNRRADGGPLARAPSCRADLGLHSGDRSPVLARPLAQAGGPAGRGSGPVGRGRDSGVETETIGGEARTESGAISTDRAFSRAPPVREACHCETSDRRSGGGCPDDVATRSGSQRNTLSNRCSLIMTQNSGTAHDPTKAPHLVVTGEPSLGRRAAGCEVTAPAGGTYSWPMATGDTPASDRLGHRGPIRCYDAADLGGFDPGPKLGEPGAYPYTRGVQRDMYRRPAVDHAPVPRGSGGHPRTKGSSF